MNEQQRAVYFALSVLEYTPGIAFTPRIDPKIVPRDDIHKVLKELESMALAELVYGMGWRAIESEESTISGHSMATLRQWRAEVEQGLTMLGLREWIINESIKAEEVEKNGKQD